MIEIIYYVSMILSVILCLSTIILFFVFDILHSTKYLRKRKNIKEITISKHEAKDAAYNYATLVLAADDTIILSD